jgi:hypothetical protein
MSLYYYLSPLCLPVPCSENSKVIGGISSISRQLVNGAAGMAKHTKTERELCLARVSVASLMKAERKVQKTHHVAHRAYGSNIASLQADVISQRLSARNHRQTHLGVAAAAI